MRSDDGKGLMQGKLLAPRGRRDKRTAEIENSNRDTCRQARRNSAASLRRLIFASRPAAPKYLTLRIGSTKSSTSTGLHKGHGAPSHRCALRGRGRSHGLTSGVMVRADPV